MPQGDDYITSDPTPAPAPVAPETPAAPAPVVDDDAAAAPADSVTTRPRGAREAVDAPDLSPTGERPSDTPDETPEQAQKRSDRAFAAMRRANEAQAARIAALEARLTPAPDPGLPPTGSRASGAAHGDWTSSPTSSQPSAGPPQGQAPQPEAFATHAEYVQAVATWAVQQHEQAKAQAATATSIQTAWESQEAQAKTKFADYDEALAADTTRYHPAVLQAIQTSEQGAEVAYHLATHPEEATRIAALAPVAALRALGKLEARLEAQTATFPSASSVSLGHGSAPSAVRSTSPDPTPTPTPKPRPLTPVGGAGTGGSTVSPDAMDYDAYTAWYQRTYGSR